MEEDRKYYYTITEDYEGLRLDQFLSGELRDQSRSYIQKLIKGGQVTLNEKPAKASAKIHMGDQVFLLVPPLKELEVVAEKMDLDIVYEDEDVILVNKPKDMVVHPCAGRYQGTLVNGLLYHCADNLSGINGVLRPGIVHRIDKDTTGLLVVCKNDMAHKSLAAQLKEHSITRQYEAIVYHNFSQEEGTVDAPIGRSPADRKKMAVVTSNGKRAVTHYKVLSHLNHQFNHIACQLETGRTHQIRVHMSHIHHPLLGDTIYGPSKLPTGLNQPGTAQALADIQGQCLHAKTLGFIHPRTGKYMEFQADLPPYFTRLLTLFSQP